MCLLLLTPGFPEDESDSTCVPYLQVWLKEAVKYFDIKIITFQYPYIEKHYKWNGIEVYSAGGDNCRFPFRLFIWLKIFRQAIKWNRELPFSRITSFWATEAAFIGSLIGKRLNLPQDIWIFGQDAKPDNRYPFFILHKNNFYISISPSLTTDFETNHRIKSAALIPLGLSIPEDVETNTLREIDIVGLGSLTPLKHYEQFIEIIHVLKKDFPAIRAVIIGEGKERSRLQAQIEARNLTENLVLKGLMEHKLVFEQLKKSKILLHTSEYEGQGVAYWEALACGCYVAAKPVGYLPDTPKTFATREISLLAEQLKSWLSLSEPDYTPFIYKINRTISDYQEFISKNS